MASEGAGRPPPNSATRGAGLLLLATAAATAVAVIARVAADADQPTLAESLAAISESSGLYGAGGLARLVSGGALVAAAWFLSRTWATRERLESPLAPILLGASGLSTVVSGACALVLVASAPGFVDGAVLGKPDSLQEATAFVRWFTGKTGFAAAGLALLVAARYEWKAGGALRRIAPVSAATGVAMQFIWIDAATAVHRITGTTFFLWLLAVGTIMLVASRAELRPRGPRA